MTRQRAAVERLGFRCCDRFGRHASFVCDRHDDPWECPDATLMYSEVFREFGIPVRNGGTGFILITHCPWCGAKLPLSLRDAYFDEIARLGHADSAVRPLEFESDEWWRRRGL